MKQAFFITGTDTGAGKTVLTALLARFLRKRGLNAAALKPVCSGGHRQAQRLKAIMPDDAAGMHGVFHGHGGLLLVLVVVDQFNVKGVSSFKTENKDRKSVV